MDPQSTMLAARAPNIVKLDAQLSTDSVVSEQISKPEKMDEREQMRLHSKSSIGEELGMNILIACHRVVGPERAEYYEIYSTEPYSGDDDIVERL
jgi:hypothetical protein